MNCPKCGSKCTCVGTRHSRDYVYRRKRCNACGYVFYTEEYELVNGYQFHELERERHRALRQKKT